MRFFVLLLLFPFLLNGQISAKMLKSVTAANSKNMFIFTIDTGSDSVFTYPLDVAGAYNFTVDWGDGSRNFINSYGDTAKVHKYNTPGIYTIKSSGAIASIIINTSMVTAISQWGGVQLINSSELSGSKLTIVAKDAPNTQLLTDMHSFFHACYSLSNADLNKWDVSNVTNFSNCFINCYNFNGNIDEWDVSNAITMQGMFNNCYKFNRGLASWDVSNVSTMGQMFIRCYAFDQDLGDWDISSVTDMTSMFFADSLSAVNYSETLRKWALKSHQNNVSLGSTKSCYSVYAEEYKDSLVTDGWSISDSGKAPFIFTINTDSAAIPDTSFTIAATGTFDCIVHWGDGYINTSSTHNYTTPGEYTIKVYGDIVGVNYQASIYRNSIIDISQWGCLEFSYARGAFSSCLNLDISAKDAPKVTSAITTREMFYNTNLTAVDFSKWDFSNITSSDYMFENCYNLVTDLSMWDVSSVTSMSTMFKADSLFASDLSTWDVSKVVYFYSMFEGCNSFNSDLSSWNTASAVGFEYMFKDCGAFEGDVSSWDISNLTDARVMFYHNDSWTTALYDKLLIAWAAKAHLAGVNFWAYGLKYSAAAASARATLVTDGWSILDDGQE